jgi:hypothetical protein
MQQAWEAAGHAAKLNSTLYYQAKRRMGVASDQTKARRTGSDTQGGNGYLAIERSLDQVIAQAASLGSRALAEDLRQARRKVAAAMV